VESGHNCSIESAAGGRGADTSPRLSRCLMGAKINAACLRDANAGAFGQSGGVRAAGAATFLLLAFLASWLPRAFLASGEGRVKVDLAVPIEC
jgi:hypothetical protein